MCEMRSALPACSRVSSRPDGLRARAQLLPTRDTLQHTHPKKLAAYASRAATLSVGGAAYSGDLTWYNDAGTVACGQQVTGSGTYAAISMQLSTELAVGGPSWPFQWCGRSAIITAPNGRTATVSVIDRCAGCAYGAIDVTPNIFQALGYSLGQGRIPGIQWRWA